MSAVAPPLKWRDTCIRTGDPLDTENASIFQHFTFTSTRYHLQSLLEIAARP